MSKPSFIALCPNCLETAGKDVQELYQEVERQSTESRLLAKSLLEAMEWNWIDSDYPEAMCDEFFRLAQNALRKSAPASGRLDQSD